MSATEIEDGLTTAGHPVVVWRQPTGFGPTVWAGEFGPEHGRRPYWMGDGHAGIYGQQRVYGHVRLGTSVQAVFAALEADLPMVFWRL